MPKLSEELDQLFDPEPKSVDIEHINEDESTLATRVLEVNLNDDDKQSADHQPVNQPSRIRRKQIEYLSSYDQRYSGRKIDRKDLDGEFQDLEDDDQDESADDEDEDLSDHSYDSAVDDNQSVYEDARSRIIDPDESIDEEMSDQDPEDHEETLEHKGGSNERKSISIMNDYDQELIDKARSLKNQLLLYESLLNLRMKMQKLLSLSNCLPLNSNFIGQNETNHLLNGQILKGLHKLQRIFLDIDDQLFSMAAAKQRKRKLNDPPARIRRKMARIQQQYPKLLDEWYEKTKLINNLNKNLRIFEQSFDLRPSRMIEMILMDKDRLIRRTKIARSELKILDQIDDPSNGPCNEPNQLIFDDDDFYQYLLKKMIESKSADPTISAAAGGFNTHLMKSNKKKASVDTKASKGRKLRYDVHEKLVNFMAPEDRTTMIDEAKNDLFKSLFGNFTTATTTADLAE